LPSFRHLSLVLKTDVGRWKEVKLSVDQNFHNDSEGTS
jgi:hypothetical protein